MPDVSSSKRPLRVAWISDFPIEWLAEAPDIVRQLPRQHPTTWMRVLLEEWQGNLELSLHVIVLRKGIERDIVFERNGVRFHVLKTRGLTRAPSLFWTDTRMVRRVLQVIQPDLVHAWGTERGAALVGTRLGLPCLVTIQGLMTWYNSIVPPSLYQRLFAALEDHALRRARHVSGESTFTVKYIRERYPHLKVYHAEHAPGRGFHQVCRLPQTQPTRFLFTGHLDFRKGGDVLFAALNKLVGELDFQLVHAGSLDQRLIDEWKKRTSPELLRRYVPLGRQIPSQIAAELAKATMVIMPTRADTGPIAVKEAVAAGVPVLATAVGGIPDYVTHGENGWLIPTADTAALVEAIRGACKHPLFGMGKVSPATHERMREYLSPQRMAEGFMTAYKTVLREP